MKTIGSYWPYATTVFDYIRRAMPYPEPHSLTNAEAYALTAYLLHLNGVIAADAVMDAKTLPKVTDAEPRQLRPRVAAGEEEIAWFRVPGSRCSSAFRVRRSVQRSPFASTLNLHAEP